MADRPRVVGAGMECRDAQQDSRDDSVTWPETSFREICSSNMHAANTSKIGIVPE